MKEGIKQNLLRDSVCLTKEEFKFLEDSIQEYLKPFNINVKLKMLESGLSYTNKIDHEEFIKNKYVFKPNLTNKECHEVGGVLQLYDLEIKSKNIQCSDEAYNNYIYMITPGIIINKTDPNNITVNSLR